MLCSFYGYFLPLGKVVATMTWGWEYVPGGTPL